MVAVEARLRLADPSRHPAIIDWHVHAWCRAVLRTCGVDLRVEGSSLAAPGRGRLVVSNHRSPFDIPILLSLFGGNALSRADLVDWPLLGVAARRAGTIFVNRSDRSSGVKAIRAIRTRLKTGGSVIVFPEGTTFRGDEVRAFQGGTFAAVRELDVQIVPVGLAYPAGLDWQDESFVQYASRITRRRRLDVGVAIGSPIAAAGSADSLAARTQAQVQTLTHRARELQTQRGSESMCVGEARGSRVSNER